jgi:hypothetical protein
MYANKPAEINHFLDVGISVPSYAYAAFVAAATAAAIATFGAAGVAALGAAVGGVELAEKIIEEVLEGQLGGPGSELADQLNSLTTLMYNHNAPYAPGVTLERIPPNQVDYGTNVSQCDYHGIDIVLVADNFSIDDVRDQGDQTSEFNKKTDTIANLLLEEDSSRIDNARLRAMGSVIRFWRLPIYGQGDGEVIATETEKTDGSKVASLSNLARLAETGLRIEQGINEQPDHASRNRTILVVLSRVDVSSIDDDIPRAIALGDVVLLPIT